MSLVERRAGRRTRRAVPLADSALRDCAACRHVWVCLPLVLLVPPLC
jgi:hypothetical protein